MSRALDAFVALVVGAFLCLVLVGNGSLYRLCDPHPDLVLVAVLALMVGGAAGAVIRHRWAAWTS